MTASTIIKLLNIDPKCHNLKYNIDGENQTDHVSNEILEIPLILSGKVKRLLIIGISSN